MNNPLWQQKWTRCGNKKNPSRQQKWTRSDGVFIFMARRVVFVIICMISGGLWVARAGSVAKAPPLAARPVGNGPGQFLGSYATSWEQTAHLLHSD